jgi:mitochondrial fission protein ELM1
MLYALRDAGELSQKDPAIHFGEGLIRVPASKEVWVCISPSDRAGDIDQVKAIGWALDPQYRCVDLAEEHRRLQAARSAVPADDSALPPRAIVGIGRRRIEQASAIRDWSGGVTRLIHIGRDRGCLNELDHLITTPAFRTSPSPKILTLALAPSDRIRRLVTEPPGPGSRAAEADFRAVLAERRIRPSWINVFLGNPPDGRRRAWKRPVRLLAERLDRLAARSDADLVITGSPRTDPALYDALGAALRSHHYLHRWSADDAFNPFDPMLRGSRHSVVTGDSISMISQLIEAGHRSLIFPWGESGNGMTAVMRGLSPWRRKRSKNLAVFCFGLYRRKLAAPLDGVSDFAQVTPQPAILDFLFQRLREGLR